MKQMNEIFAVFEFIFKFPTVFCYFIDKILIFFDIEEWQLTYSDIRAKNREKGFCFQEFTSVSGMKNYETNSTLILTYFTSTDPSTILRRI